MLISEDRVEKGLMLLAQTDLEYANWKGAVLRTEYMAKVTEAMAFKQLEGGVEERKQAARTMNEVKTAWEEHFKAVVEFERLRARREREVIVIELFRTLEATRRKGTMQ